MSGRFEPADHHESPGNEGCSRVNHFESRI
jgi:hypothetical protein